MADEEEIVAVEEDPYMVSEQLQPPAKRPRGAADHGQDRVHGDSWNVAAQTSLGWLRIQSSCTWLHLRPVLCPFCLHMWCMMLA